MIRFADALMLARTKRRTRKLRTGITIAVAGLLFGILTFALFVIGGVSRSVTDMTEKSMSGRYIVSGSQGMHNQQSVNWEDPELIKDATDRHAKLIAEKTREAKRLGIAYDPKTTDPLPYQTLDAKAGTKVLSPESPIAQDVLTEAENRRNPTRTLDDFKRFANNYSPSAYYTSIPFVPSQGDITEMREGKESFEQESKNQMSGMPDDYRMATFTPSALVKNYLFEAPKWKAEHGTIPVLVTQKRAAALTGHKEPSKEASAGERLGYAKQLRERVNGKTFSVCYRNTKSQELITQAKATQKEIAAQSGNKEYQKPDLIYDLPDEMSCGAVSVQSDTRTAAEKAYAAKQKEFDALFGGVTEPIQRKITYQVVGMLPNGYMDMSETPGGFDAGAMIDMLFVGSNFRFAIPAELYDQLPDELGYKTIFATSSSHAATPSWAGMNESQYFAEFTDADQARSFAKNESCTYGMNGCSPPEKWFSLSAFGSNSIALEDAGKIARQALVGAGLVVVGIAAIICGATIGRAIADGRRETAVFRAIGFKRTDISQIYLAYTVLLCIDIALFALLFGAIGALVLDHFLWVDATNRARLLLGLYDGESSFHFVGLLPHHMYVIGAIIATGVVGMALPLIRNIRRNPIRDMRDE